MKSGKTKIRDSIATIGNLKEQLNCVLKEMHAFTSKIEDVKAHIKDEDLGFKRFADLDTRFTTLSNKYKPGKESSRATMFLIKTIIETLSEGPMSEKDIKVVVLDRCKELGIKSTNRGTIAGLNMDVGVACNILGHLGAIELHTPGTSTPERQKEVASQILAVLDTRWDAQLSKYLAECKKEAQAAAEAALAAAAATAAAQSTSVLADPALVNTPGAPSSSAAGAATTTASGGSVDCRLLSPLSPEQDAGALPGLNSSADLADLSFGLDSPLAITSTPANAGGAAAGGSGASGSHQKITSAPNSLASSGGGGGVSGGVQVSSAERNNIAQCFDHSPSSSGHLDALVNLDQSALADSELMDTLMVMGSSPLPEDCVDFDDVDVSPEDFALPPDDASIAPSTKSNRSSVNNSSNHASGYANHQGSSSTGGGGLGVDGGSSSTAPANANSSSSSSSSRGQKAVGSGRRSTATQKQWRIKTDHSSTSIEGLLRPEETLKQWGTAAYKESLSLEIEEHLLRRIAGQCDFHLKPTPFRAGTRYLDPLINGGVSLEDPSEGSVLGAGGGVGGVGLCTSPSGTLGAAAAGANAGTGGDQRIGLLSHNSTSSLNGSQHNNTSGGASAGTSGIPALYDDHVSITGSYLLDKVKRSKRQRGSCLYTGGSSIPQFNINYIHSLSNICNSTTSHYWNNTLKYASNSGGHHHHHHSSALSSSASLTSLSSFMQGGGGSASSSVGGGGGGSGVKKTGSVSGRSGTSSAASDVGAPYNLYPKHYSQPTYISGDWLPMPQKPPTVTGAGLKVPLYNTAVHMPDLSTYTTEEPWSTVSREFVVLSGEDAGAVFWEHSAAGSGATNKNSTNPSTSATAASVANPTSTAATSAASEGGPVKKQKLSKSGDSSGNLKGTSSSSSSSASTKKNLLPAYDVAAPQFREVIPPPHNKSAATVHSYRAHLTSSSSNGSINGGTGIGGGVFYPSPNKVEGISHKNLSPAALAATPSAIAASATASSLATLSEDGSDPEEDLSDEAVLARHDAVLRNMREKWALMQQLKLETRRGGAGGAGGVTELTGGGGYRKMTTASAVGSLDGSMGEGFVGTGGGAHMKYRKYATTAGAGDGSAVAVTAAGSKKAGAGRGAYAGAVVSNGLTNGVNNSMKRRGRPPKFVKSAHGGTTSQRGNNQYTAIRAAAAAAAALSLQLQQQQSTESSAGLDSSGEAGDDAVGLDEGVMDVVDNSADEE